MLWLLPRDACFNVRLKLAQKKRKRKVLKHVYSGIAIYRMDITLHYWISILLITFYY